MRKRLGKGTIQRKPRGGSTLPTEQTVSGTDGARAAYLFEKNQLLSERVVGLEVTLERKYERLKEFEADSQALREQLNICEDQLKRLDLELCESVVWDGNE